MPVRTMPNNLDAEKSVLGCAFLSKNSLTKMYQLIAEQDKSINKKQQVEHAFGQSESIHD